MPFIPKLEVCMMELRSPDQRRKSLSGEGHIIWLDRKAAHVEVRP